MVVRSFGLLEIRSWDADCALKVEEYEPDLEKLHGSH